MPLTPQSIEEKPYNACLNCAHIGKNCDGPNFLTMSSERWCEWCRLRKEYLGWTSAQLAEKAGISKVSVDRVMAGNIKDVRISTVQAITKALVNGSWGMYPCAMTPMDDANEKEYIKQLEDTAANAEQELAALKESQELAVAHLKNQIAFLSDQIIIKDKQLSENENRMRERYDFLTRKDNIMKGLVAALAVALAAVIALLAI